MRVGTRFWVRAAREEGSPRAANSALASVIAAPIADVEPDAVVDPLAGAVVDKKNAAFSHSGRDLREPVLVEARS